METYVVRMWIPDRPGALGQVASRIGAVRGDVVGIEILERGAGRAIDELVVSLPEAGLVDVMVAEIGQVDGVDVEDVRLVADALHDPRLDALETAAQLVAAQSTAEVLDALCTHAARTIGAQWAVVVDLDEADLRAGVGPSPSPAWLAAFVTGSRSSASVAGLDVGPDDVLWAPLPGANPSPLRHGSRTVRPSGPVSGGQLPPWRGSSTPGFVSSTLSKPGGGTPPGRASGDSA